MTILITILASICGIILIIVAMLFLMAYKARSVIFNRRYDDNHTLHYFTAKDFENLEAEPYEFKSDKGQILRGFIYRSTSLNEYKGLLILSHGIGAGHLQYTSEIDYFAKRGYLVLGFDYTGCNLSEGKCLNGFAQPIIDLHYALEAIAKDEKLKNYKKVLYGHSMGAYTVNNITYFKHDIKGIVSLSSFDNTFDLMKEQIVATIGKFGVLLIPFMRLIEKAKFKQLAFLSSTNSLRKSEVPTLLIHGDHDKLVDYEHNFLKYQKMLSDKKNIRFLTVANRFHRPNITIEAALYAEKVDADYAKLKSQYKGEEYQKQKKAHFENLDYKKLTDFDTSVMDQCVSFLDQAIEK